MGSPTKLATLQGIRTLTNVLGWFVRRDTGFLVAAVTIFGYSLQRRKYRGGAGISWFALIVRFLVQRGLSGELSGLVARIGYLRGIS